jgi:hypothetical protein
VNYFGINTKIITNIIALSEQSGDITLDVDSGGVMSIWSLFIIEMPNNQTNTYFGYQYSPKDTDEIISRDIEKIRVQATAAFESLFPPVFGFSSKLESSVPASANTANIYGMCISSASAINLFDLSAATPWANTMWGYPLLARGLGMGLGDTAKIQCRVFGYKDPGLTTGQVRFETSLGSTTIDITSSSSPGNWHGSSSNYVTADTTLDFLSEKIIVSGLTNGTGNIYITHFCGWIDFT